MSSVSVSINLDDIDWGDEDDWSSGENSEDDSEADDDDEDSRLQKQMHEDERTAVQDNETLEQEFWDHAFTVSDPVTPIEWILPYQCVESFFKPFAGLSAAPAFKSIGQALTAKAETKGNKGKGKDKECKSSTLCVGCGNSSFSEALYADSVETFSKGRGRSTAAAQRSIRVVSMDISPVVVKQMKEKYGDTKLYG